MKNLRTPRALKTLWNVTESISSDGQPVARMARLRTHDVYPLKPLLLDGLVAFELFDGTIRTVEMVTPQEGEPSESFLVGNELFAVKDNNDDLIRGVLKLDYTYASSALYSLEYAHRGAKRMKDELSEGDNPVTDQGGDMTFISGGLVDQSGDLYLNPFSWHSIDKFNRDHIVYSGDWGQGMYASTPFVYPQRFGKFVRLGFGTKAGDPIRMVSHKSYGEIVVLCQSGDLYVVGETFVGGFPEGAGEPAMRGVSRITSTFAGEVIAIKQGRVVNLFSALNDRRDVMSERMKNAGIGSDESVALLNSLGVGIEDLVATKRFNCALTEDGRVVVIFKNFADITVHGEGLCVMPPTASPVAGIEVFFGSSTNMKTGVPSRKDFPCKIFALLESGEVVAWNLR